MSTSPESVTAIGKNIASSTLKEVLELEIFKEIHKANYIIPAKCSKCCWYNACGGGNLVSRFSEDKRFDNHSIYCDALQEVYAHVAAYLINTGVPQKTITDNLFKS